MDANLGTKIAQELARLGFSLSTHPIREPSSAGQKRDADGQIIPSGAGGGAGGGGGDGLTKAQRERARKKEAKERKRIAAAAGAGAETPAGETGTPGKPGETTPTTGVGAEKGAARLLASGEGFQLFAPPAPYKRDMEVCRAWGKAFFAGGTAVDKEPCGWKACFGRCNATGAACIRDHNIAWPAQLKAALKANSSPEQAKRFSA